MAQKMMTELEEAISVLKRSARGEAVLRGIVKLMDEGASGLDQFGQQAALYILTEAWGPFCGTTLGLLRDATE